MRTVKVYEHDCLEEELPEDLTEHIEWLKDKLKRMPAEFRKSAMVEIVATTQWGCGALEYTISYKRPETEEELAYAIREVQRKESEVEVKEIAELERLKAKYS